MPEFSTLILFAAASIALTTSPGPDMVLIASRTVSQGRKSGFVTLAGIQVGTFIHAAAAALGLSQLFLLVPVAYEIVRWAGAAYLLYLAWTSFRSAGAALAATKPLDRVPLFVIFRQGLITNLLNPKMALFVLALFPQFVDPAVGSVGLQIMIFATVINVIGLMVNGTVIVAADQARQFFTGNARIRYLMNYLLSAVFAGLAVRLALSSRE